MPLLTPEFLQAKLPQVGDRLVEKPNLGKSLGCCDVSPRPCVVTYVNPEHLWYMVEFENGLRDCYKLPKLKFGPGGGLLK